MSSRSMIRAGLALAVVLVSYTAAGAESLDRRLNDPRPRAPGSGAHPSLADNPAHGGLVAPARDGAEPLHEPTGDLTLREALALALSGNPGLTAFAREIRARAGNVRQAGLLPNPVLGAASSNLGNAVLRDFDGPATTVSLSQLVLLGGKRARAIEAATLDQRRAAWDHEVKRLDVITQTAQAFIEVLRTQEGVTLAADLMDLAERVVTAVAARVQAGKVSPVEETRARVILASVQVERTRALRELEAARARLAASWGSIAPRFKSALGKLGRVSPIPTLRALEERLEQNPDLARWATEVAERQASVALEKSRAVPDLTVSLGVTEFHDTGDSAVIAGLSIPLPVFNRNEGSIQAAEERLTKALDERRAAGVGVHTALNAAYQRLAAAHTEVETLKQEILPGAQSAFEAANEGYRLGKFGFLDVLDAQRTLFGAKGQYLRALSEYHKAVADMVRLIGERPETMSAIGEQEESR
ncbi:MAG: TolC family protein [Gammaproteobacteria bacterium]